MAVAITTIQTENKLVEYTKQINREFVRDNMFSPYISGNLNAIFRIRNELKNGGDQMNVPMVARLKGTGVGSGPLVGNEERIDNYGMRVWLDWARNAVATNKAEKQKDSADVFGEAKPLLSDWGKELQRDELIEALMALPSTSAPVGLGTAAGDRVNGIRYDVATAAQKNTWNAANSDRILYGSAVGNYNATHATALANVDTTSDRLSRGVISLAKRTFMKASKQNIRPYKTNDGYDFYVAFAGSNSFRDLKADLDASANLYARPREGDGMNKNPIFQDGDLLYDGVIIRQVPEISTMVDDKWTSLLTAGLSSTRVEPVFFCGQQAASFAWGQMAKPTFRKEDDYGFITGTGVEMAYGIAKMFKSLNGDLVQWGMGTIFVSAPADA